jgi:1-acyl-sn-glycerol-3-phosphate acyltransferase
MAPDLLAALIRIASGICVRLRDPGVLTGKRIYFANHTSHLDFAVIWASLPSSQRKRCVPVAAKDYWETGWLKPYLAKRVFRAVLLDRERISAHENPLDRMDETLARGDSLIIFPEGTRSLDGEMRKFKPGLYHLAKRNPEVPLVPICLENLNRILPKGELLPVPLLSAIAFGASIRLQTGEDKSAFLDRAREAIKELRGHDL